MKRIIPISALLLTATTGFTLHLSHMVGISKQPTSYRTTTENLPQPIVAEVQEADNTNNSNQRIQLALLLDTSNSMDGLIDQAKAQLWNIVNELAKAQRDSVEAEVEIALYEYGNDNLSINTGYIRQVLPFTTSLDDISEKLFALKTNGGSEYCGQVITESLAKLGWSESDSTLKVIYIAGNEEFTQGPVNYRTACDKAKAKDVVINTIFCGDFNQGIRIGWKAGSDCGVGTYMNIDSDKKTIQVATPYDDQIIQLNSQLNNTYIYYGVQGAEYKEKQVTQDANSGKYSSANVAKRTVSKSTKMYKNQNWDLVDAYEKDTTVVVKVDKNTLPTELRTKTTSEIKTIVVEKTNERNEIKKEIAELGVKRETYIKEQTASSDSLNQNTLGETMVKTIQKQATTKGFKFK